MAATRFYLTNNSTTLTPAYDSNWEQTGGAQRRSLVRKLLLSAGTGGSTPTMTVPITTTQDILGTQYISEPLPPQTINGTFRMVAGQCSESALSANATLAVCVRVVADDGTVRGTLFSVYGTGTEFPTSAQTRIVSATNVTSTAIQSGDRIVVELGVRATAPTAAQSATMGILSNQATDYALTSGLTTALNSWCEFSQDLFSVDNQNYKSVKSGYGNTGIISVGERIR